VGYFKRFSPLLSWPLPSFVGAQTYQVPYGDALPYT